MGTVKVKEKRLIASASSSTTTAHPSCVCNMHIKVDYASVL